MDLSPESTLPLRLPSSPHGPPIPVPIIKVPTADYLQASLSPSIAHHSPSASRKLLVLDLNGTLLLRSPRVPAIERKKLREAANGKLSPGQVGFDSYIPMLRKVYLRPYMTTFRAYLFAPSTLDWLDTMVWSSARPHSVEDMTNKCFGEDRSKLVAIWARGRKGQTTKDLAKPWSKLFTRSSDRCNESDALPVSQTHSAQTTLLLDDSLFKAQLQPWNHVCVPGYIQRTRTRDLQIWQRDKQAKQNCADTEEEMVKGDVLDKEDRKQQKGHQKDASTKVAIADPSGRAPNRNDLHESTQYTLGENKYDETLLAVVGILDASKGESNVAGWIRAGGLWPGEAKELGGRVLDVPGEHIGRADEIGEDQRTTEGGQQRSDEGSDVAAGVARASTAFIRTDSASSTFDHPSTLWFEHPGTMEYWVNRGRSTLEALGIEVDAGLGTDCGYDRLLN